MIITERIHVGMEYWNYEEKFAEETEKSGRFDMWNLVASARPGDLVLVYLQQPKSSFVGYCYVDSGAQPAPKSATEFKGKPWFHVRDAELLPNGPVTLHSLKERFLPDWRYLLHPVVTSFPNANTSEEQLGEFFDFLSLNEAPLCADGEAVEGLRQEIRVMALQRNRPLRDKVLKAAKGVCEACETDYSKVLDGAGVRVLQVHHRKQLALNAVPVVTRAEDLAVLCANCHALVHRNPREAMRVEDLRDLLRAAR